MAPTSVMALSAGIVDQAIERLPRDRSPRPLYPFDTDFQFTPVVLRSARAEVPG